MDATNSAMGDPLILNAVIDMLKNGQGKQITMMVHEVISKVTPSSVNLVGMKDPTVTSTTSTVMPDDISRITLTNTNVPNVGSVKILPPTTEKVSLRSLIDSQSRILRLLPDTPENVPIRQKIRVQIQLWERALLESAGPTSDEQVHQFQKKALEEDLKYALLHGSQGLRQHLVDQGEILVSGHESEEAQQSNSSSSEHEEELEDHDELFVAYNDSIVIPETRQEIILEFQQVGDTNIEEGVQCDELSTPTIKKVPRMDVLNIDWKNIHDRFVRDEFYENIWAPKWLDFLALEEPVDDDAWYGFSIYELYFLNLVKLHRFCDQYMVWKLVTFLGRASIIVFILFGIIFTSALTMGVVGIETPIIMIKQHQYVKTMNVTRLCKQQKIVTMSGQFPGPAIYVNNGDNLVVQVINKVAYNITIHWHGIKQLRLDGLMD
ncbi:hypothetical protein SUGI_0538570 [Cryptomeria japonica]|nr:hypothetical protein SUGI_0538570 [Cryptomeria japonica]